HSGFHFIAAFFGAGTVDAYLSQGNYDRIEPERLFWSACPLAGHSSALRGGRDTCGSAPGGELRIHNPLRVEKLARCGRHDSFAKCTAGGAEARFTVGSSGWSAAQPSRSDQAFSCLSPPATVMARSIASASSIAPPPIANSGR